MRKIFFDDFDFDFENYQRSNNQNRFRGIFLLAEQKENIEREVWFGFECEFACLCGKVELRNFKVSASCQSLTSEGESKKEEEPTNRTLNSVLNCSRTESWILTVTRKTSKFHAN